MKKLDLHLHTIPTISDSEFKFSLERLKEYVLELNIQGIAITNHNCFDIDQFQSIQKELEGICDVLPGIEINVGNNGFGHIICITNSDDVNDFSNRCDEVNALINNKDDYISYNELISIFIDLNKYLWIPHTSKKPQVSKDIIDSMGDNILCGEVNSVKKFIYAQKDADSLTPVLFSDFRPTQEASFPSRQTFFAIEEITVSSIKKALLSKKHVSLTENEGLDLFYVLPNLPISTGLNVVLGERSSGKTFTLDKINANHDNVKYIKQFDLIEKDQEKEAKAFSDRIAEKSSSFSEEYFESFKDAVDVVKNIDVDQDEANLNEYVSALIKYAHEKDRADLFAKCALFGESNYSIQKNSNLTVLIEAVKTLLETKEYQKLIETHIPRDTLVSLLRDLIETYRKEKYKQLKKEWVNDVVTSIKKVLHSKSAATEIPEIDFYSLYLDRVKVKKFNELVSYIKIESIIYSKSIEDFTIQVSKKPFNNAQELKDFSKKVKVAFQNSWQDYNNDPYRYLLKLKEMEGIAETDYYKYFAKVQYEILNQYGFSLSGGERAEFKLLQEIDSASKYDMLLIDEPESSFDNLFLKDRVNHIIRELSETMPVILVTHNNTVGASINPDYILYTKRVIEDEVTYDIYYGLPSSKKLNTYYGKTIDNIDVLLDCLEAGETAYKERGKQYEILKN